MRCDAMRRERDTKYEGQDPRPPRALCEASPSSPGRLSRPRSPLSSDPGRANQSATAATMGGWRLGCRWPGLFPPAAAVARLTACSNQQLFFLAPTAGVVIRLAARALLDAISKSPRLCGEMVTVDLVICRVNPGLCMSVSPSIIHKGRLREAF
jgi:hypothetical protein